MVVAVVDGSVVAEAEDNAIDGVVSLVPALVVACPEGAEALVHSVQLVIGE